MKRPRESSAVPILLDGGHGARAGQRALRLQALQSVPDRQPDTGAHHGGRPVASVPTAYAIRRLRFPGTSSSMRWPSSRAARRKPCQWPSRPSSRPATSISGGADGRIAPGLFACRHLLFLLRRLPCLVADGRCEGIARPVQAAPAGGAASAARPPDREGSAAASRAEWDRSCPASAGRPARGWRAFPEPRS